MDDWLPGEEASGRRIDPPPAGVGAPPPAPSAPAPTSRARLAKRGAVAAAACAAVAGASLGIASHSSGSPASATALSAQSAPTTTAPSYGGFPGFAPGGPGGMDRHDFDHRGAVGTVTSVTAGGFTVTTPNGTKTAFTTNSSTVYREGTITVGRSALAVGEHVLVGAARPASAASNSSGAGTAAVVQLLLPSVGGKIVSVSGSTVVVQDGQGFWRTMQVSSSTAYQSAGKTSSAAAMKAGVYVWATGTIASDHTTLDASAVAVLGTNPAGAGGPGFGFFGGPGGPGGHGGDRHRPDGFFGGPGDGLFGGPGAPAGGQGGGPGTTA